MSTMANGDPLQALLALKAPEAEARGVLFTPREIWQQPKLWLDTFERVRARRSELERFLADAGVFDHEPAHVVLVGAGSSNFVGELTASAFRECWACEVSVLPSTDLMTRGLAEHLRGARGLCVSFSRSGDTSEAVAVMRGSSREFPSLRHLVVTCNANGELTRAVSPERLLVMALDPATNDQGLAMTSSFSSMALAALAIAHLRQLESLADGVFELASAATRVLGDEPTALERLASLRFERACFLGSGPLRAVAGEAALKLLELTAGRVATFDASFLGVRHGPLAALNERTLLVGFLSSDLAERAHELDLIEEVQSKRLAGQVVLVAPDDDERAIALADAVFRLPTVINLPAAFNPLLGLLVAQVLALFASLEHGLLPDSPSPSGAINRVVSGLRVR